MENNTRNEKLFTISNISGNFLFLQESMFVFGRNEIYISAELPSVINSHSSP